MDMQPAVRHRRSAVIGLWQQRIPANADVLAQMGQVRIYLENGQADRAKTTVDAIHSNVPLNPKLLQLRAECALAVHDHLDAISLFDQALAQSDSAALWAGKASALRARKRFQQATLCFKRANALEPDNLAHLCNAAECLLLAGYPKDALKALKNTALTPRTRLLKAMILAELGDEKPAFECALAASRAFPSGRALRLARRLARAPQEQQTLTKHCAPFISSPVVTANVLAAALPPDRPYLPKSTLAKIQASANSDATPTSQKATLNHVLFRHHDFIDARSTAQRHLVQFHKLALKGTPYRRSHDSALFTLLKRLRFTALPASKFSVLPIFATGLPGSGHAYACQLLEAATRAEASRPLHLVNSVMVRFMRRLRQSGSRDINRDALMGLQSELRAGLLQAANGRDIVIDSNMLNFRWSGLIRAALPEARIVHVKSDEMQTGWAIFSRVLDDINLECRHDLNDLNAFQTQSNQLMSHWEQCDGVPITAISGDALRRPSGHAATAMLDACQLKSSKSCMPHPPKHQLDWYRYADLLAPLCNRQDSKDDNTLM